MVTHIWICRDERPKEAKERIWDVNKLEQLAWEIANASKAKTTLPAIFSNGTILGTERKDNFMKGLQDSKELLSAVVGSKVSHFSTESNCFCTKFNFKLLIKNTVFPIETAEC